MATRKPAGAALPRPGVTRAIAAATFAELAEAGYGRLSIEAVARRAGVGKTAIYRRWPSKHAMVFDLIGRAAVHVADAPDTGTLRGDVLAFLTGADQALRHPLLSRIVPDLLAEASRDPRTAEILERRVGEVRRQRVAQILHRAIERGELPDDTDIDLGLNFLAGPVYLRVAINRAEPDPERLNRMTDKIIAALRA
jgi:AcrR family transcriptional regulator